MTVARETNVYYDPYDTEINTDPYPTFARLREEAPICELAGLFQPAQRHPRIGEVEIRHARWRNDVSGSP
jgi:hypothetical protein